MYKKPEYATLEEWDLWRAKTKQRFPIKYFLSETLPTYVRRKWYRYYTRSLWYLKERFIYKAHLIDTKLEKGQYYCTDTKMLHGCFELLSKYYVDNKEQVDYLASLVDEDEHALAAKETIELYDWWKNKFPKRPDLTEEESVAAVKIEKEYNMEENEMLIRLIKIRKTLW